MITEAAIPEPSILEMYVKPLLLSTWEWLNANPSWLIGLVLVVAALLWYFLHALPAKRDNRNLELYMMEKLRKEEEAKRTEQQYWAKKTADADAAKRDRQDYFDRKRADEKAVTELEEQKRAEAAKKAEDDRLKHEKQEDEQRKAVGTAFELRTIELIKDKLPGWLDTGRAKLLHDVTLPGTYNAQIDAILVDTSGIYVIECKCWDSLILGKHDWYYWLVINIDLKNALPVIQKEKEPFYCKSIQSPIKQNEHHKNALKRFLVCEVGKDFNQFKRLTVFDTCSNIDFVQHPAIISPTGQPYYSWLGSKNSMVEAIKKYDEITPVVSRLSQLEVNNIFAALKPLATRSISSATAVAVNK